MLASAEPACLRREFATHARYRATRVRSPPRETALTGTFGLLTATGLRTTVGLAAAGLSVLLAVLPLTAAAGDPVPLPNLRPDHALRMSDPAAVTTAAIAREPVVPTIAANSRFSPDQQVALANINAYFNSFRTMEGQFIQFGPNGEQSEGVFFLSRPGKIRFHYRPPERLDIIADGSSVAVKDGRANTQDLYPLSKTPLRYLLADRIDLTSGELVDSVREEPDLISLLIVEKSSLVDGKLALIFDRKTYELRQWIVTDAQGLNTAVAIYNVSTGKAEDRSLFRINMGAGP
jgi:outer membrane lipoprotein-sorting protein